MVEGVGNMLVLWTLQAILNLILSMFSELFESLNPVHFFNNLLTAIEYFAGILSYVYFFLPVAALWPLVCVVFFVIVLKIVMSVIRLAINVIRG